MNRLLQKKVSVSAVFIASALVLAACAGADAETPADGDATGASGEPINISALDQGTSGLALKVIEARGLDETHGFNANFAYIASDASTQDFLQGQSDINFNSSPNDVALAAENGYDAIAISSEAEFHAAIIAPADSPYDSMEDLKGGTIGWYGSESTGAIVIGQFLQEYEGIDFFNDYSFVQTSPSALVQLLAAGEVDAIMDFQPWNSWAQSEVPGGVKTLFDPNGAWKEDTGGAMWMTSIAVMRDFLEERPDETAAVVAAWCEAADYLNSNIDEVLATDEYVEFLEPLTDEGLAAFGDWVTESQPFSCDWSEDQIDNANEFLDALAADGALISDNPGDLIVSITD